jgi:hypothetical protein
VVFSRVRARRIWFGWIDAEGGTKRNRRSLGTPGQGSPLRYALSKNISTKGPLDCRSLGFPDFLSRVAASVSCVWFSLERTTSVVAGESSEAGNLGTLGMTKERATVA